MALLALKELKSKKGIPFHPNTLREMVANGSFPAPLELSPRVKMFRESDIDKWLSERPEFKYQSTRKEKS